MKCPILPKTQYHDGKEEQVILADCLKEECAWWEEAQGECSIKTIARGLEYISTDITQVLEKLSRGKKVNDQ